MNIHSNKLLIFVIFLTLFLLAGRPAGATEPLIIDTSDNNVNNNYRTINPFGSFIKSAVIPGWGELGMHSQFGYAFLGVELLLWASRFYYQEEINLHEKDAYLFALNYAGLKPNGYDDEFLHKLTRYNSSGFEPGGYNEYILIQARRFYPDDENRQNHYIMENAILDDDYSWYWDSRDHRRQYSIKRKNADHNRDYVKFVTGAIVANHIISAINSLRMANQKNRMARFEMSFDLTEPRQPMAHLSYKF